MVLYRAEAWGMRSAERRKVNVLEMKCLRSEIIEMVWVCGKKGWVPYGQKVEVSGGWVRGRLRLDWMDGVKVALGNRGMKVEVAWQWKIRKCGEPWYICNWMRFTWPFCVALGRTAYLNKFRTSLKEQLLYLELGFQNLNKSGDNSYIIAIWSLFLGFFFYWLVFCKLCSN